MIAFLQDPALVQEETAVELRRVTPADREALVEMYLSFEPKGAAMSLPPRKDVDQWLDSLAGQANASRSRTSPNCRCASSPRTRYLT